MAANTTPIFTKQPAMGSASLGTSAVTGTDGTDANVKVLFTADATNGSKIEDVYIQPLGTNSTDTVVRFWINNGSSAGTALNNTLVHEEVVIGNTFSQTAKNNYAVWRANLVLKPGYRILTASGAALSVGMHVTAVGGDY